MNVILNKSSKVSPVLQEKHKKTLISGSSIKERSIISEISFVDNILQRFPGWHVSNPLSYCIAAGPTKSRE